MRPAARSTGPDRAEVSVRPVDGPTDPCLPRLHTLEGCAQHIHLSVSCRTSPRKQPGFQSPGPSVPLSPKSWDLPGSGPVRTEGGVSGGRFDLTQWA